jgi:hypothetical protein
MMRRTLLLLFSLFRKPYPTSSFSTTTTSKLNIFDRQLKRNQRDRAAWLMPQNDPLLHTVADNLLDCLQMPYKSLLSWMHLMTWYTVVKMITMRLTTITPRQCS